MKTILYVGSGASAAGDNIPLTPGGVAGTSPGDLVLIVAGNRLGTAKVRTPDRWKALAQNENISVLGKVWARGDIIPQVTFSGGAAGETTLARVSVFRFTEADINFAVHGLSYQSNGVAQDIAIPALPVTHKNCAIVNAMIKQDDGTDAARAGFPFRAQNYSTAGNDAGTVFFAKIQTVATNEPAGTVLITGGAPALSWSIAMAILPYVTSWTDISSTDRPCDFVEEFNRVSDAACAAFLEIESEVAALTNVPASRISVNTTTPVVDSSFSYTTVDIDPTGMVDLVSDPDSVALDPPGIWMTGIGVNVTFTGLEGSSIEIGDGTADDSTTVRDLNTTNNPPGGGGTGVAASIVRSTASIHRTAPQVFSVGNILVSIRSSELYVFRLSD